eukprot:TRINITY_DN64046_c0_g1_i1.p1 TRINITY_DN64046_c0_g1~~TRINITY_DN64046_c0_g1_i1.p1  ORF type:complete len:320 (-),score=42.63 TRINITY_DN64046_c0_g1_i1:3-962(-)
MALHSVSMMLATLALTCLTDVAAWLDSRNMTQNIPDNDTILETAARDRGQGSSGSTDLLECSFLSFPLDHAIPSNAIAAGSAVHPTLATPEEMTWGLDFAGLWWMNGNVLAEEFVSWHGATSNNPNKFPMEVRAPSNLRGRWVWPYSIAGTTLMSYYAVTEEPSVPQVSFWTNSSYGRIVPIAGGSTADSGFQYVVRKDESDPNGDTWIRENLDSPEDDTPEFIYKLVRIVNGDGTPNAVWWPEFKRYAEELGITTLQIWGNDNGCMRACETVSLCSWCKTYCNVPQGSASLARRTEACLAYFFPLVLSCMIILPDSLL